MVITHDEGNNPVKPEKPDLASVSADDWPHREFPKAPGRVDTVVPVVIKQSILNAIHQHGQQSPNVEVCGVLVGEAYRDEIGPFVYVEGSIRGDHAGSQVAQVTFTGDTWNHVYEVLDRDWPDKRILGWYHTHPGFGIFLSGMDLFIHENFFGEPEQLAHVYDPLSGDEGLFIWQAGEPCNTKFLVEMDEEKGPQRALSRIDRPLTAASMDKEVAEPVVQLASRVERIASRQNAIIAVLALTLLVAIIWPVTALLQLSGHIHKQERRQAPTAGIRQPVPGRVRQQPLESERRIDDVFTVPGYDESKAK